MDVVRLGPMQFDRVLSFGRTGEELLAMFGLDPQEVGGLQVLDCPGGPGSLSCLLRRLGAAPTAVDPSYGLSAHDLEARTLEDIARVAAQQPGDPTFRDDFDREGYFRAKQEAFRQFQADRQEHPQNYLAAALPRLPFADQSFDLVLSGSLLFAYAPVGDGGLLQGAGLDLDWHAAALQELLRVCRRELRVYPAHTLQGGAARIHPYVAPLLEQLPPGWNHGQFPTRYDQGIQGEVVGLRLWRAAAGSGAHGTA
ncbi:class I SAM-dependent methyltransferase [Cyanobium sp. NIES-981]|uniref:class I SAM-dependent methyltransferase n=1 Tax=Cyanobium sp. NIES-981 TaxID=1851505 RepID=UPI0007DE209A|nr:class I SAM-dependent methyltransferase [Cyanobium sp. NIES-981]SBO42068.1 Methylase involved in ubiquinone/menaquinone biosynthesis [Cyanobium sp. NIES-981]